MRRPFFVVVLACAPALPEPTEPDPSTEPGLSTEAANSSEPPSSPATSPQATDEPGPETRELTESSSAPLSDTPPRHVLLIVIDTLRADAIDRSHTPHLDSLIERGQRAETAWASGTWTVPSVISLLTGSTVLEHGWNHPSARMDSYPPLPQLPRLSTVLSDAGFGTHGLYSNPYLALELDFEEGFDTWRRTSDLMVTRHFAELVQDHWSDEQRQFTYLHLLGPHSPVDPSPEAQARHEFDPSFLDDRGQITIGRPKRNQEEGIQEAYRRGYLGTLEDTDVIVGQLLEALGEYRDDTLIVLTSDHGELLGEHDIFGHGTWVWRELVEVPLIVDGPGPEIPLPSAIGIHAMPDYITRVLSVPSIWPQQARDGALLVSQREEFLTWSVDGTTKYIAGPDGISLYDLSTDPGESQASEAAPEATALLNDWRAAHPPIGGPDDASVMLPEETLEELRALGYLEP